jgi:hypothetical protein
VATVPAAFGMGRQMFAVVNLAGQALLAGALMARWPQPRLLAALEAVFLLTALILQILLLVDPRYRDFPTAAFAVPLVAAVYRLAARTPDWPEALVAAGLAGTAIAGAVQEGIVNRQSLVWCAVALVLAAPPLVAFVASRLPRTALPAAGPGG